MAEITRTAQKFDHRELVRRMLALYNGAQGYHYAVTRWPDEEDRTRRACDAFAEAVGGQPLAIEHTNIETFNGRKLDDARFLKAVAPLEAELNEAFPYWVFLWIPIFAMRPGTKWDILRSSISTWLRQNVPHIPQGRSKYTVPEVPFPITVAKNLDMPQSFLVGRLTPPGGDDNRELVQKFCAALRDKDQQLRRYRESGAETILLAESDDIALASLQTLYRAFLLAWDRADAPNIRQVWMAHSYAPENWCEIVCFLGPEELMDRVNPPNYAYGPRHREMWFNALRDEKFAGFS